MIEQIIPSPATVAQRPVKLAEGFGGILRLNAAYCLCLVAAVRALPDDLTIAAISSCTWPARLWARLRRPQAGWAWWRRPSPRG